MDCKGSNTENSSFRYASQLADIDLTSSEAENKIPIGKFIFQLKNLSNEDYQITLAWGRNMNPIRTKEDDLLDETREAMNASSDWKVGCSTVRKNA